MNLDSHVCNRFTISCYMMYYSMMSNPCQVKSDINLNVLVDVAL